MTSSADRVARLRAGPGAKDQISGVFLAGLGAERAERGLLRALIAARAAGGGVLDVEAESGFEALRAIQEFLRLRGGDMLSVLVIHGAARVTRSGEVVFPVSPRSLITATQLRAVLRSAEIGRQVVVLDCDAQFETPPRQGAAEAWAEAVARAFRVAADDRLVIARKPGDSAGLTSRLAAAIGPEAAAPEAAAPEGGAARALRLALARAARSLSGTAPLILGASEDDAAPPPPPAMKRRAVQRPEPARAAAASEAMRPTAPMPPGNADVMATGAGDADDRFGAEAAWESAPAEEAEADEAPAAGVGDGKLHHDIPRRMRVARAYEVRVAVSRDPSEAVKRGLGGQVSTHDIRVAGMMAVSLRDPEDAFDIDLLSEAQQPIDHGFARSLGFPVEDGPDRGLWVWRVRPRRWGDYPLTVHATAYVQDSTGRLVPAPEQNDRIHVSVRVNYGREAGRVARWFVIALLGYVLIDRLAGPAAAGMLDRVISGVVEMLGMGGRV